MMARFSRAATLGFVLIAVAATGTAQFAGGTIFQSLDAAIATGVTAIQVPGNPSLTTGEILCYSQGWTNGLKSLYSAEALGALVGDRDGDLVPNDWVNVDAMHLLSWTNTSLPPTPFEFLFSFEYDLLNQFSQVVISKGDVIRLTGQGTWTTVISEAQFRAAVGVPTTQTVNVDGLAMMPDGTALVSFLGTGSASNVVNPLTGSPGNLAGGWTGADIFAIRQPYGALPAVLVYRVNDLAPIATAVLGSGYTLSELRDFDFEPNTPPATNPWDPAHAWNGGFRPHLVFHAYGDENVLCTAPAYNPAGNTYYWAHVEGSCTTCGKLTTVGNSSNQVAMDALAISSIVLPSGSAITLDTTGVNASTGIIAHGGSLGFTVRNLAGGANRYAAVVLGTTLFGGTGYVVGTGGYNNLIISPFDPLLLITLQEPFATLLRTGASDANGTANTTAFTIPSNAAAMTLYAQAIQLGPNYPLSSPTAFRIQ